ncbi:coiled-coil domain-containing protein 157-like isoform X2 [Limulus polyphemus]|uniref:Coiled-coil domain-containing protein 157-like isoform X2 n=1 Tax=Limulus polyphemus TaxID=6850 RepID=A0ABM1SHK3_LIMPO|nr:coiled-coil domain-containing protein 157-like isoform X2 [Limulus polyphemus]
MAYLLGSQTCIESLQSDVADVESVLSEVLSHTGLIPFNSWKFPGTKASDVSINELLNKYTFSEDAEESQVAHISLQELLLDRMIFFIQATSLFVECFLNRKQTHNRKANKLFSTSVGLAVQKCWSVLNQLKKLPAEVKAYGTLTCTKFEPSVASQEIQTENFICPNSNHLCEILKILHGNNSLTENNVTTQKVANEGPQSMFFTCWQVAEKMNLLISKIKTLNEESECKDKDKTYYQKKALELEEELKKKIAYLENLKKVHHKTVEELQKILDAESEKVENLNANNELERKALEDKLLDLQTKLKQENYQTAEYIQKTKKDEITISNLQQERNEMIERNEILCKKLEVIKKLETEFLQLEGEKKVLDAKLRSLLQQLETLAEKEISNQVMITQLKSQISVLEKQKTLREAEYKTLKRQV